MALEPLVVLCVSHRYFIHAFQFVVASGEEGVCGESGPSTTCRDMHLSSTLQPRFFQSLSVSSVSLRQSQSSAVRFVFESLIADFAMARWLCAIE